MAFDAYFMSAVLQEVRQLLPARVEKIHQSARDTIVLSLKTAQGRKKLLFVANPAAPRLHLTEQNLENPAEPPVFCMLLRKHLSGGRLTEITQSPMERCCVFSFSCVDELGDLGQKRLVVELMGRTCNLYLLSQDNRILDCLRRVGLDDSAKRQALPGLYYQAPDPVNKKDPALMTQEEYRLLLEAPGADVLAQRLMDNLGGLSPLVCREAALFAAGDTDARVSQGETSAEKLYQFFREHLQNPAPYIYYGADGSAKQYAFCPIRQYGGCSRAESFSALLDTFYAQRGKKEAMQQKSQQLRKTVNNLRQRLDRKLALQEKELAEAKDRERIRQLGDILTANLHKIQKGQTQVCVADFYDPDMKEITVALSPLLSPQQNAAKLYKDYAKKKTAEKELTYQLEAGYGEREYLSSVLEELNRAESEQELEEIRKELQETGYLRRESEKKAIKKGKMQPMRFVSTDGYPIFVGRNNIQNQALTFHLARKDDLWLHAQKVHGSHVIIACAGAPVPDDTITQAAQLAAYYAETGGGQNVPVDVTPVKQVKKIPGGKPGMVIYHSYRTVVVNPYKEIVVDKLNAENPEE